MVEQTLESQNPEQKKYNVVEALKGHLMFVKQFLQYLLIRTYVSPNLSIS